MVIQPRGRGVADGRKAGEGRRAHGQHAYYEFPCSFGIFSELSGFRETARREVKVAGRVANQTFATFTSSTLITIIIIFSGAEFIISFNRHPSSRMNAQRLQ
jgi:hypothetical protein